MKKIQITLTLLTLLFSMGAKSEVSAFCTDFGGGHYFIQLFDNDDFVLKRKSLGSNRYFDMTDQFKEVSCEIPNSTCFKKQGNHLPRLIIDSNLNLKNQNCLDGTAILQFKQLSKREDCKNGECYDYDGRITNFIQNYKCNIECR